MKLKPLSIALIGLLSLQVSLHSEPTPGYTPLYAGTMLAIFPLNVEPGLLALQSYLFTTKQPGFYDNHGSFQREKTNNEISLFFLAETGITHNVDITLLISGNYDSIGNHRFYRYADTQAFLGFQILRDQKDSWIPDLRVLLGETFPTGKYQHLDPSKLLSDSSGTGSYKTSFILVSRKIFYYFPRHPFNFNLNLMYTLGTKIHVEGYNVYGGTPHTKDVVTLGNSFLFNLATEYSFSRHWVFGMDIRYLHQNRSPFTRQPGGAPSSEQFSLAPCLEYNYNEAFGVITGAWFTIAGRNSNNFLTGVASIYYEF